MNLLIMLRRMLISLTRVLEREIADDENRLRKPPDFYS